MADESPDYSNAIAEHVVRHIGPITNVFHEARPYLFELDILVLGPHDGRPHTTLVTCGMSELPMRISIENPDDLGRVPELRHAELLLALPPDWPLTPEAFEKEEHYWPVRWLKKLARFPHLHEGWLGLGHTVPNGDPPEPFAANTRLCGWLVDQPLLCPAELQELRIGGKVINFYATVPLYEEEMALKVRQGSGVLGQLLDRAKVTELIDQGRPSVTT